MAKLITKHITNLQNESSASSSINANFEATAVALENTLSRDGTSPNQMSANLDMNSNRILNLPLPAAVTEPVRLGDLTNLVAQGFSFGAIITDTPEVADYILFGDVSASDANKKVTIANFLAAVEAEYEADIDTLPNLTSIQGKTITLGGNLTTAGAFITAGLNSLTLTTTGTTDVTLPTTGTVATLAGSETLTNKTLTTPTLNTPVINTPDINGGTADSLTSLSVRSTGAAFDLLFASAEAITANRTLTYNVGNAARTITLSGNPTLNDWFDQSVKTTANPQFATIELGAATDTTISRSAAGIIAVEGLAIYSNIPQNSQSAAYTTVLADAQKHILHPTADNNARTFTIDSNANVAYPVGTAITFINQINTVTIAITSDTLTLAGAGTTGSRTLAANGIATAIKIASTSWIISGTGLT